MRRSGHSKLRLYPGGVIAVDLETKFDFVFSGWHTMDGPIQDEDIVQPEPSEFKLRISSRVLSEVPMHWGLVQEWLEDHMWDVRIKANVQEFYTDIFFKTRELYLEFVDKFPGFLQGS